MFCLLVRSCMPAQIKRILNVLSVGQIPWTRNRWGEWWRPPNEMWAVTTLDRCCRKRRRFFTSSSGPSLRGWLSCLATPSSCGTMCKSENFYQPRSLRYPFCLHLLKFCARRCVDVGCGCCFGGADGCILPTMLVDVCQCCCLLMFVCLPLSRHLL